MVKIVSKHFIILMLLEDVDPKDKPWAIQKMASYSRDRFNEIVKKDLHYEEIRKGFYI